jgi:acyl-homoserine-lactone acylase
MLLPATAPAATPAEMARWKQQAAGYITRDEWGIAHVTGRRDADAVFGAIYAQARTISRGSRRTT